MKNKFVFPIVAILLITLACQLSPQPTDNGNISPTEHQETIPQATHTSVPTETPKDNSAVIPDVEMVLIPAGDFIMGDDHRFALAPKQTAHLEAYFIDIYEVTNALYKSCVDAGVCDVPLKEFSADRPSHFGDPNYDNYPVIYVDWFMANAFCQWRGARLPTGAEWEKAARGTDGFTYPWGEDNTAYAERVYLVGMDSQDVSPFGVYDMGGNVAEWVEDLTPKGRRLVRGGSPLNIEPKPSSWGMDFVPTDANDNVGFRCARTP